MTKLQIFALLVNLALLSLIFVTGKKLNDDGGEDAMSDGVETIVCIAVLIVFDVTAAIIHFVAK